MTFLDYVAEKAGTRNWAVAHVRRGRVLKKYEHVFTRKQFDQIEREWAALEKEEA